MDHILFVLVTRATALSNSGTYGLRKNLEIW